MEQNIIIRHRIFLVNLEKEQKFIDGYREKGYKLVKAEPGWFKYTFLKCGEAFIPKVRIDYRTISKRDEYENYIALYEDAGWKLISGDYHSGRHYFEQMSPNIEDEIFSDSESYSELYKRLFVYALFCFLISILCFFPLIKLYDFRMLTHPRDLFLTPGLWESSGFKFIAGFLFELPFVLWRNGAPIIWTVFFAASLICMIKSKMKEKALKDSSGNKG